MAITEVTVYLLSEHVALLSHLAIVNSNSLDLKNETLFVVPRFLPSLDHHVLSAFHHEDLKVLLNVNDRVAFHEPVKLEYGGLRHSCIAVISLHLRHQILADIRPLIDKVH